MQAACEDGGCRGRRLECRLGCCEPPAHGGQLRTSLGRGGRERWRSAAALSGGREAVVSWRGGREVWVGGLVGERGGQSWWAREAGKAVRLLHLGGSTKLSSALVGRSPRGRWDLRRPPDCKGGRRRAAEKGGERGRGGRQLLSQPRGAGGGRAGGLAFEPVRPGQVSDGAAGVLVGAVTQAGGEGCQWATRMAGCQLGDCDGGRSRTGASRR